MGLFLNSKLPYEQFKSSKTAKYYVDKSELLVELFDSIGTESPYICITRPRRFGKSVAANMIAAFFGKGAEAEHLFCDLVVAKNEDFKKHLNSHNVIYIDFSIEPECCSSYHSYIMRILDGIKTELWEAYSELSLNQVQSLWDILAAICQKTGDKFIFVIDEWDAPFHLSYITEQEQQAYLRMLRSLLKGQAYVELAYMTGILPIAKYSDGSELNMFLEYSMVTSEKYSRYFGFSDAEVDFLFAIYKNTTPEPKITRDDLRIWYDGYYTASKQRIYNPRSIVSALKDNQLRNYWTSSGTYDSIFGYIKDNIEDVQDDLALMFAGEAVPADVMEYAASNMQLNTKDEIYSAMVVYGLLTYHDGCVLIPNKELMKSYAAMMKKETSLGYIYQLANASNQMLKATLTGDTSKMAEILEYAHNTESPILSYNSEIELAAVVNLVYLSARDQYHMEREDKAGEGYVDFIFYPVRKNADGIILELKVDASPEEAIEQIKEKKYSLRFKGKLGEIPKYTGRILAVGISYNRKTKRHYCKVETLM